MQVRFAHYVVNSNLVMVSCFLVWARVVMLAEGDGVWQPLRSNDLIAFP